MFSVSAVLSFIVGFALLGTMTFLPTYLQYCQGVSATVSGLRTLPMVLGLIVASVSAGNVVSHTGRYRVFPIVGSVVMALGMWALSRLDQHSTTLETSGAMLVLGVGIGLSMQVLTIIVQNTVEYRDLGVATSGVTFFRTMGSSFGAAVFGTIYANHLAPNLAKAVAATGADPTQVTTPSAVHDLPLVQQAAVIAAYADTLQVVFASAIPVAVVAFVVALFLKQVPMRGLTRPGASEIGPALRHPRPTDRAGAARGSGRRGSSGPGCRRPPTRCSSPRRPVSTASRCGPSGRSRSSRSIPTPRPTRTPSPRRTACRWR